MDQMSLRQKTKSALQRLDELEQRQNTVFANMSNQFNSLLELVDGLIAVVGEQQVTEAVIKSRTTRLFEQVEAAKKDLEARVQNGELTVVETPDQSSLIVGTELDKDGNEVPPGFFQGFVHQFKPEFQEKIVQLKVGDVLDLGQDGRGIRLDAIYHPVAQTTVQ